MGSERLRWLNFFHGRQVDAADWDELYLALQHWEDRMGVHLHQDGTGIEQFPVLSQVAGDMAVQVGAWAGLCDGRPMYQDVNVTVPLDTADSGSLLGSTLVPNPGESRWIVVTAQYVDVEYDAFTDADGLPGYFREDHGIRYRVFMGAAAVNPVLPLADLATAYTNEKAVQICAYQRQQGELDTTPITMSRLEPLHRYWIGNELARCIRDSSACLASMGVAQCRRLYLSGADLAEDTARLPSITPAAAAQGGTVQLTGDHIFLFSQGRLRVQDSSKEQWISDDLAVSSTYFLRAKLNDYQSLELYLDTGALPAALGATYSYPASLVSSPGLGTGCFPSTEMDCLLAKVVTGLAGTVPTVTVYRQGDFSHVQQIASATGPTVHTLSFNLPTPHACDMEVIIQHDSVSSVAPSPPPVGTYVTWYVQQASLVYYNFETVRVYGLGQWLDDLGGGALGLPAAANGVFRPALRIIVQPKRRPSP